MGKRRKTQQARPGRPDFSTKPRAKPPQPAKHPAQQPSKKQQHRIVPTVPFSPTDRILLVGEGDLSFAASLVKNHGCTHVTATVLEEEAEALAEKYPHAAENAALLLSGATASAGQDEPREEDEDAVSEGEGEDEDEIAEEDGDEGNQSLRGNNNSLLYGIDATKPLPGRGNSRRSDTGYDRILFNFPHVGGVTKDVNRQVRLNQSLLVSFFQRALPALRPRGFVVVTLFEGEPYTLWNVRDLARHAGLQVDKTFRFQWGVYPGYHHARTLGVIKNKKGEEGGGWKGEERAARSYVFVRKGEEGGGKKRKRTDESDSGSDSE